MGCIVAECCRVTPGRSSLCHSPLVSIEQPKQQTEDQMTDDILEKRGPGGEFGQFPTPGQRVIFIDKWSQPPRRDKKQFPKNGPFEPVWARQEAFEDRRIDLGQDDAIEEMKTPGQQSKLLLSWRFPGEKALDEADVTVPIACESHIGFHDEAVSCCGNQTRESCARRAPIFSNDATFHLVHGVILCVRWSMLKIIGELLTCSIHRGLSLTIECYGSLPIHMPARFSRTVTIIKHAGTLINT